MRLLRAIFGWKSPVRYTRRMNQNGGQPRAAGIPGAASLLLESATSAQRCRRATAIGLGWRADSCLAV